jgi:hypothetical protein
MSCFKFLYSALLLSSFFGSLATETDGGAPTRALSFDDQMGILLAQQYLAEPAQHKHILPSWLNKKNTHRMAVALIFIWLAYDFYVLYETLYIHRTQQATGWWSYIMPWLPFITMERHMEFFCRSLTPLMRTTVLLALIKLIKLTFILV